MEHPIRIYHGDELYAARQLYCLACGEPCRRGAGLALSACCGAEMELRWVPDET